MKYVICVEAEGQKKYVLIDNQAGISRGVDDKTSASVLPNRAVAFAVVNSLRPVIKKNMLDAKVYYETL